MNYKSFNLGDWIGHISGVIEDETTLDGNEMRDLVEFLTTLKQKPILDKIRAEVENINVWGMKYNPDTDKDKKPQIVQKVKEHVIEILDKYKADSEVEDADTN